MTPEPDLRGVAIERLRKKRELQGHLVAFVMVNGIVVLIWYATTPGGFFWPIFPILGWGIGVVFHLWDVLSPTLTQARIEREMRRLSGRGGPTGM